jgi:hypothetical protein
MAEISDIDEVILRDRIARDLFPEFEGSPEEQGVRQVIAAELDRWRDVPIRDFVPIFVERRLRRSHALGL